jgi:hypothetical protein
MNDGISYSDLSGDAQFNVGSNRIWVYYPEGLFPGHHHFQTRSDSGVPASSLRICRGGDGQQRQERQEHTRPSPGHALYQESFHVCRVKDCGDIPGVTDIYVETVVDGKCGLAFAQVSSSRNPMDATSLLQNQVLPFYAQHGALVAEIFTPKTHEYCGLAPFHPFETLLVTSHIDHRHIDLNGGMRNEPCEEFNQILCQEFFAPAIRNYSYKSFVKLQKDLDVFVAKYNYERPCFKHSSQGLAPYALFSEAGDIAKKS